MNLDFLIDQLPVSNFDLVQHEGISDDYHLLKEG